MSGSESRLEASVANEAKAMATMDGTESDDDAIFRGDLAGAVAMLAAMVAKAKAADSVNHAAALLSQATIKDAASGSSMDRKREKKLRKALKQESGGDAHDPVRWELRGLHLGDGISAGKTANDAYAAFLRWSQKPEDKGRFVDSFNLSKAFRRLETFANFSEKHFDAYLSTLPSLEDPKLKEIGEIFAFKVCDWVVPDGVPLAGCVLWVFDLGAMDIKKMSAALADRSLLPQDMLRWMWALMVESMWDPATQIKGLALIQDIGCTFSEMIKMNSAFSDIEAVMNEMFYQAMPIKMKVCFTVGSPFWLNVIMGIMRMFLSKKMSSGLPPPAHRTTTVFLLLSKRLVNTNCKEVQRQVGGAGVLPVGAIGGTREYQARYTPASKAARITASQVKQKTYI